MRSGGLIVVGVDGSESAQAALEFALEEAARWSAHVRVVSAFHPPEYWPVVYGMAGGSGLSRATTAELADDAERTARQALVDATGSAGATARTAPVDVRVVLGSAGQVLLDQAADAVYSWSGTAAAVGSRAPASGRWDCSASCMRPAPSSSSGASRHRPHEPRSLLYPTRPGHEPGMSAARRTGGASCPSHRSSSAWTARIRRASRRVGRGGGVGVACSGASGPCRSPGRPRNGTSTQRGW